MQICVLSERKINLVGREFSEDGIDVDSLLTVDLAELDWGHGLFDAIEYVAIHHEARQVVTEDDGISALKAR